MRWTSRPDACDRWLGREETDSLAGTDGAIDHYARAVVLPSNVDLDTFFQRLEERLLTYQVFPPRLMKALICSEEGRLSEGTTIVQRVAIGAWTLEGRRARDPRLAATRCGVRGDGVHICTLQGHPEGGVSTFRIRRDAQEPTITF